MRKIFVISILLIFAGLIDSADIKNLKFELFWKENESDPNYIFSRPNQFVIDKKMNLYIVDSQDLVVRKYNCKGEYLYSCGKRGVGPGEFRSIGNVIVTDNSAMIISFYMINVYDNEGKLIHSLRHNIKNESDLLYNQSADNYVSYRIDEKTKRFLLSVRKIDDTLVSEIASYPADNRVIDGLGRPLPCYLFEKYTFGINSKSEVIYAFSENFEIFSYSKGKRNLIIKEDAKPIYIPDKKWKTIDGSIAEGIVNGVPKRIGCVPPHYYSMIQDLMIDGKDNIWIKALTTQFNGFIKYSPEGKMLNRYIINNEVDYRRYDWQIMGEYLYHKTYDKDEGLKIFRAKL